MSSPETRDECVYLAKLAEQAERYDEMVSLVAILYSLVWFVRSRSRTISTPGAESYHYRTLYFNSNKRKKRKINRAFGIRIGGGGVCFSILLSGSRDLVLITVVIQHCAGN